VVEAARAAGVRDPADSSGLPTVSARDAAAKAFRLDRLDADRVLEWHLEPDASRRGAAAP
jgi:hypothetical protein